MVETILAVALLILASELWIPLAFCFGVIKFLFTFSLSAAWVAAKSVPFWIWGFAHDLF